MEKPLMLAQGFVSDHQHLVEQFQVAIAHLETFEPLKG
jgi:hypothetical protein